MKGKEIWILEDDPGARSVYGEILNFEYTLRFFDHLGDFGAAKHVCSSSGGAGPHLVIADLRLPDGDFLEFLGREETASVLTCPLIIVSSVDDLDVLRSCFLEGALDYLTKPFAKNELIFRVERILAGSSLEKGQEKGQEIGLEIGQEIGDSGGVVLDRERLLLTKDELMPVRLTVRELQIFSLLNRMKGQSLSRQRIQTEVWGKTLVSAGTLDVHLYHLRRKLNGLGMSIQYVAPDGFRLLDGV